MKVGFVGLGHMGSAMAANLLKAGYEVAVYNRTPSKAQALVRQGARFAEKVADACKNREAVITMLPDDAAAEVVVFGGDGVLGSLRKGAVHVSSSTISVALSEKLAKAHAEKGQRYVAAPVMGRPDAAAAARLWIIAAGAPDAVDTCLPLLEALGQKVFRFGDNPADANTVKLCTNFLITAIIESLGEALALIGKAGLDRHQYVEFLTSSLFSAPIFKTYGAIIAAQQFEPAGFAAPLGLKDNRLVLAAAENLRVPLPLANLIHDRFMTLLAQGGESLDWSAISTLPAQDSGLGKTVPQ
ncbi:MAG TPA: NAD(P)-dependent oxidoreductase [Terriglobales bacterium]|nr:NAD(P)-dependent oxidoreductase [Terriglobales bacterium]